MADRKKILVADDEQDCRDYVEAVLGDDYELALAKDGNEALEMITKDIPDLVILDVQMPEKGGFDVFHDLKKNSDLAEIPVIMLTGVREKTGIGFSKEEMGEYFGEEPDAYVEKPVDADNLMSTVKSVLEG